MHHAMQRSKMLSGECGAQPDLKKLHSDASNVLGGEDHRIRLKHAQDSLAVFPINLFFIFTPIFNILYIEKVYLTMQKAFNKK